MAYTPEQIEQFRKDYGFDTMSDVQPTQPTLNAFERLDRIKNPAKYNTQPPEGFVSDVKKALQQRRETVYADPGTVTAPELVLRGVGQGIGLVGDVGSAAIKRVAEQLPEPVKRLAAPVVMAGSKVLGKVGEAVSPIAQEYQSWAEKNPRAAADLESAINIAGFLAMATGGGTGVKAIQEGYTQAGLKGALEASMPTVKSTAAAIEALPTTAKTAATALTEGVKGMATPTPSHLLEEAKKYATPAYEPKLATQVFRNAEGKLMPRVSESKGLGKRTVSITPSETQQAELLSSLPDFNPKLTNLEQRQFVLNNLGQEAQSFRQAVQDSNIIIPKSRIRSAVATEVNKLPDTSLILQKKDPTIKSYMKVVDNGLKQVSGNPEGLLDLRQILDDAYENVKGGLAYGTEKRTALDEVHQASRNVLGKLLKAQPLSVDATKSLERQTLMYRLLDTLGIKAEQESMTAAGRFMQQHPVLTKATGSIAGATGIGGALYGIGKTLAP